MARTKAIAKRYIRKGNWSTRLTNFSGSQSAGGNQSYIIYQNLAQNPAQSVDTISSKYTVKNIVLDCEITFQDSGAEVENLQYFIMYIPQGYIPTGTPSAYADVPYDHPEWIMTHRFVGSPQQDESPYYPPIRTRTRLARKLDTGDRIVLIILGQNTNSTNSRTIEYRGLVKYNAKAN